MFPSGERLKEARLKAGYQSAEDAARKFGWKSSTYRSHENGQTEVPLKAARKYADAFKNCEASWIVLGNGKGPSGEVKVIKDGPLKRVPIPPSSGRLLTLFGAAMAGKDGKFVFGIVDTVACPPGLETVQDAYAVYVAGNSMETRYFSGEIVYVHPKKPIHKGVFVVVQLHPEKEGDDEEGLIKQFVSMNAKEIVLHQLNPDKLLRFPASRVKSVHRIVMSGDA